MGRAALIILLGFIVIFGSVLNNMTSNASQASDNAIVFDEDVQARHIAKSAIDYLISLHVLTGVTDSTIEASNYLSGSYNANVVLLGSYAPLGQDTLRFTATGTVAGQSYTTTVTLVSSTGGGNPLPQITAAINLYPGEDGTGEIEMRSWSLVNGNDTNPDGTPGEGPNLPAISSTNIDSTTLDRYGRHTQLEGEAPTPEIAEGAGTLEDIIDYADTWKDMADYYFEGDTRFSGHEVYGTADNPAIVFVEGGDVNIVGSAWVEGYGIFVVRGGKLKNTAHFHWQGLVLVLEGEGGDEMAEYEDTAWSSIYGALIVGGNTKAKVGPKAHSEIAYSKSILDNLEIYLTSHGGGGSGSGSAGIRDLSNMVWWE